LDDAHLVPYQKHALFGVGEVDNAEERGKPRLFEDHVEHLLSFGVLEGGGVIDFEHQFVGVGLERELCDACR
jgi:hypothetical protein